MKTGIPCLPRARRHWNIQIPVPCLLYIQDSRFWGCGQYMGCYKDRLREVELLKLQYTGSLVKNSSYSCSLSSIQAQSYRIFDVMVSCGFAFYERVRKAQINEGHSEYINKQHLPPPNTKNCPKRFPSWDPAYNPWKCIQPTIYLGIGVHR